MPAHDLQAPREMSEKDAPPPSAGDGGAARAQAQGPEADEPSVAERESLSALERPPDEDFERLADAVRGTYLSLEEFLSDLLERIRLGIHADTAAVLLLDEARDVLLARAAKGLEEEVRVGVQVPLGRGFAGRVAAQATPVILQNVSLRDVVNPILVQRGIRSLLGVPIMMEGRVIGVMHVGTLTLRDFSDEDVRLVQLAADRAASAIDSAQLTEQRAATALMQRTLLPETLPQLPGLRFSAKYLPAGAGVKIGGDWYDVLQMPDGRVALVIGDVVGRGVMAASVMAEVRTAARAYLLEGHELPRAMSLLDALLAVMGRGRSATMAVYALDLERGELSALSAGHLPGLLVQPDGTQRLIAEAQGPPLGMGPWRPFDAPETFEFPPGSVLLLYTDGLIERRTEAIDRGFERLQAAASRAPDEPGATFADRVYAQLVRDTVVDDDVALLAVESMPLGERLELSLEASPHVVAGLRRTVARWLMTNGVSDEARFDIVVALSEAAGNAIEHAYGVQDAGFSVCCERRAEDVLVVVRDSGRWLAQSRDAAQRGRGLMMMRELMDRVDIEREPGGTTVTMVKEVGRAR